MPMRIHSLAPLLAALLALAGCGESKVEIGKAEPGKVPLSPQRPGDPALGRDYLLNRAVVTCGIPLSAYRAVTPRQGPAPPQVLAGRTGRNTELPYGLTAFTAPSGVELVTSNCLGCHAAPLDGEIVLGLGNEFLDFTQDPLVAVEAAGAYVEGEAEAREWRRWADRIGAVAPYMTTDTLGVNPANNLTLALFAHRDPDTLAWSERPLLEPPPERPLPVSVPPWWNMGKKHAMFYSAEGRGDHTRYMILASTTCTDSVAEAAAIDAWFVHVRAYLATLAPPPYPFPIDATLAADGGRLFDANCRRCHGSHGAGGRYPNLVIALDKVGTDPLLATSGYQDADRFIAWLEGSFYGELADARPALGYIAPPLDGIWATAPYLHNGSVPTLAGLLDSRRRPAYWRFAAERPDYDRQAVGWDYVALEHGKAGAAGRDDRRRIYDTDLEGYSNRGHTFGDDFTAGEHQALLEYLKTL